MTGDVPIDEAVRALHPPRVGRLSVSRATSFHCGATALTAQTQDGKDPSTTTSTSSVTSAVATRPSSNRDFGRTSSSFLGGGSIDVSSHHVSAASSASGPTGGGGRGRRFSQLLLEHGEQHLQDWAAIAASAALDGSSKGRKSAAGSGSGSSGGKRRKKGKKSSRRSSATTITSGSRDRVPSIGMAAIPGRLRLCTRSVVFEPTDTSRGIIRCSFARLLSMPRTGAGPMTSNGNTAVLVRANRHVVMKAGNITAPHETVDVATEFRFTLCHSDPVQFLDLMGKLFVDTDGALGSGETHKRRPSHLPSPSAIDRIIQPMLDRPFDPNNLLDIREVVKTGSLRCHHLSPLQNQPGCSIVTDGNVYFQPAAGVLSSVAEPASAFPLTEIVATARRYHGLRDCAVELYMSSGTSILLAYETKLDRERVMSLLPKSIPCHTDPSFVQQAYEGWSSGQISNFDYLLALNSAAGRTFHDLSRYPVFPWVIADYESEKLDLNNPATFRDLSKPVGALNEERLQYFMNRYKSMEGDMDAFLYGTHYSAPGYVLYYLVRSMPEQMLCLQNGKFDAPDRMFHDLDHTYSSILTNHADVKELIAEFYDPEAGYDFLINARGLRLGTTQTGERVHDVKLPNWAKSPRDFLKKNRMALECDVVSAMLPSWIDLIFGDNSRGQGAKESLNLFHPTAYLGSSAFEAMETEEERMQAELQATEFGICPDLLFCRSHPLKSEPAVSKNDLLVVDLATRAMSLDQLGDDSGEHSKTEGADQPWELLETPAAAVPPAGDGFADDSFVTKANTSIARPVKARMHASNPFDDNEVDRDAGIGHGESFESAETRNKKLLLKGSGRGPHSGNQRGLSDMNKSRDPTVAIDSSVEVGNRERIATVEDLPPPIENDGWKRESLLTEQLHNDTVSGCSLLVQQGPQQSSYLASVGLDGRMLVHTLPFLQADQGQHKRRGFSSTTASTITRLSYLGLGSDTKQQPTYNLNEIRAHSSTDPLACLALIADDSGGRIAFAGGHDDVVFAYGINSACALASVYSHRDAVTGIDLIKYSSFATDSLFGSVAEARANSTHIMVTGSWDATVKVWSVSIAAGETVSIDRDPLAELFDADASIVSVSVTEVFGTGIAIAAGCSDGGLIVWICRKNGTKEVLFKEEASRGASGGSCASVQWAPGNFLFAASGDGRVTSYILEHGAVRPISRISVESPAKCLALEEENLFVGCLDGSLKMITIGEGAHFNTSARTWKSVNGNTSSPLASVSVSRVRADTSERKYLCATGGEDGSIAIFELNETSMM